jgi:hypothetical protein
MDTDTFDFLRALTFAAGEDSPIVDAPPSDFHPDIVAAVSRFCAAFRERCNNLGLDPDAETGRSFGGNVYFSLSGHGCGFWDDSGPWGQALNAALEHFAGGGYRFEELSACLDYQEDGEIHLSFIAPALPVYMEKYFSIPDVSALPDFADCLAIAHCPAKADLRVVPSGPFTAPPYWTGEAWILQPFTVAAYQELLENVNG